MTQTHVKESTGHSESLGQTLSKRKAVSSYALTLGADLAFENRKVGKTQSPGASQGHVAYIYTMGYSQLKSQA